jgi:hydrogenase maturation protease
VTRTLVAGVGNVFFGDDGFGPEVVRRLVARDPPADVSVRDFGIRGVHLAYELASGWDRVILVDAMARGQAPGKLHVIEPTAGDTALPIAAGTRPLDLGAVFAMIRLLGRPPRQIILIGAEAQELLARVGLSATMTGAVEQAVARIEEIWSQPAPGAKEPAPPHAL